MSDFESLKRDLVALSVADRQRVFDLVAALQQQQQQVRSPQGLQFDHFAFVGMWRDRPEMRNSTAWVRTIRQQQWRR